MCLVFKKWTAPQIATEDIKVYKFLRAVNNFYSIYTAPFYSYCCYGSLQDILNTTFRRELSPLRAGSFVFYTSQGLYSYKEVRELPESVIWFECVIPKGAAYYLDDTQEYCSNELKFVKKLAK